ncbi:MAG: nucleotidyl transferase AbiEii/AbiGii toxin family protein [Natronospirillum sp.]
MKCYSPSDLYAGKVHALLFRQWKNRVKGRDWFDFEWYIRQGIPLNLTHLSERAKQSGDWLGTSLTASTCKEWLYHRIDTLDVQSAKHDVVPFINDAQQLDIWSKDYFRALADKVTFL